GRSLPAARQRFGFQLVNFSFLGGDQSGLERREPIITLPFPRDGAQGAAGQFGQRMVRDRFPAIEKKRNFVAGEYSLKSMIVRVEAPDQDAHLAITSTAPDMPQNFARGKRYFAFRLGADRNADSSGAGVPPAASDVKLARLGPVFLEMAQRRGVDETVQCRFAGKQLCR